MCTELDKKAYELYLKNTTSYLCGSIEYFSRRHEKNKLFKKEFYNTARKEIRKEKLNRICTLS